MRGGPQFKVVVVASWALLALACTSAGPASQTPTDGQPRYGGIFRATTNADPNDYDMTYAGSTGVNGNIIKESSSSLMRFKTGPDIGYMEIFIEPSLAERWEISPDAKTYTFHLRKGVRFADLPPVNGREITAADVKWSYEYTSRTGAFNKLPTSRYAFFFEGLESIQTPDPYTVVVKFKEAFAPFLTYAASSDNFIYAREIYDQDGHFHDRIVGSGPFQLDRAASLHSSRWVTKKNPGYFEEGKPYLDEVHYLIIVDDSTRLAAFQTKQIDFYGSGRGTDIVKEVKGAVPDAVEHRFLYPPYMINLNSKRPPLDNMKVRKAFSLATDRDELVKVAGGGEWALAYDLAGDLFTQEEIKSFVKYDPAAAKRLLAEAGYPQGFQVKMFYGVSADLNVVAPLLQSQYKKAGIDIVLDPVESAESGRRRRVIDYDIMLITNPARIDVDGALFLYVHSASQSNFDQLFDAKGDALIEAQRKAADPAKRREILRETLRYFSESALLVPTWRTHQSLFWHPYVKDFYHHADVRNGGFLYKVWLAR